MRLPVLDGKIVIKVTHIVTGLAPGGAEKMLAQVVTGSDSQQITSEVISLTKSGDVGEHIRAAGICVKALGMRPQAPNPWLVVRLARWLRESRPDMVQTWMYHADLVGSLAARLAAVPVVWGIHHSNLDPVYNKRRTLRVARLCAQLSRRLPARIVCCSESTRRVHIRIGYAAEKMQVIPNGFDLTQFRPRAGAGQWLRDELGLSPDAPLIGMAARFHPLKDHSNFVSAAARLHATHPEVNFLLCGEGTSWKNPQLAGWIAEAGLRDKFHLLGHRKDMPLIYAALSIATSASRGEAFPLAVGEAMACGTPCVVTDVGDSALLVGDTGRVVPAEDPIALALAWQNLLECGAERRLQLGLAARRRIQQQFSLPAIVERYQQLYLSLAEETPVSVGVSREAALPG